MDDGFDLHRSPLPLFLEDPKFYYEKQTERHLTPLLQRLSLQAPAVVCIPSFLLPASSTPRCISCVISFCLSLCKKLIKIRKRFCCILIHPRTSIGTKHHQTRR